MLSLSIVQGYEECNLCNKPMTKGDHYIKYMSSLIVHRVCVMCCADVVKLSGKEPKNDQKD